MSLADAPAPGRDAKYVIRQVHPIDSLRRARLAPAGAWVGFQQDVLDARSDVKRLTELNAKWFNAMISDDQWIGLVWLINTQFTQLGVAPGWRGLPRYVRSEPPRPRGGIGASVVPYYLGRTTQRNNLLRWIDLEWLRATLGPGHQTRGFEYNHVLSENDALAHTAWARLNKIAKTSGSDAGATPPHRILDGVKVPKLVRVGLTGLIDKATAGRIAVAEKRLRGDIEPRLQTWSLGRPAASAAAEVAHRLKVAEAIELAQGSPTDAATVLGWMTGSPTTKQAVAALRTKMCKQLGLTRAYWVG